MESTTNDQPQTVSATLLDGRALARKIRHDLKLRIAEFETRRGHVPTLATMRIGDEPDAAQYSESLERWLASLGLGCSPIYMDADVAQQKVLAQVRRVSEDEQIHGLLIFMPLPAHISYYDLFTVLNPLKDVEGLHPENQGLLASGRARFVPTTPLAGMALLDEYGVELSGKHAVILGRSNIVGRPLAQLMLDRDASVTVLHSRSRQVAEIVREADIVAAAAGRPGLITADMLRPGAVVLDFGINFVDGKMVGDVDYEPVRRVVSMITPVPGGIGPLTNMMLARNLMTAVTLQAVTPGAGASQISSVTWESAAGVLAEEGSDDPIGA